MDLWQMDSIVESDVFVASKSCQNRQSLSQANPDAMMM
jgi:hypothetical protein